MTFAERVQRLRRSVGSRIAGVKAAADAIPENFRKWFDPVNIFALLRGTGLATNETIFGTVSKLANSMASMPLALYDSENRRQSNVKAAETLMFDPNPNMHRFELIRLLEVCRNGAGNGLGMIDYDHLFLPEAIWPLDPGRVTPLTEKKSRDLWYRVNGDAGVYYVHSSHMIHVKHIPQVGGVAGATHWGISPLDVLKGSMDFDAKVREFSLDDLETSVRASFILKMATNLGDPKKKAVLDSFKAFYAENGGVLLQEAGTEITPIEKKLQLDPKVFDVEKITERRVAKVFGMPDHSDGDSYNSREQKALEYVQDTMVPIVTQYEAEFDRKLLTPDQRRAGLHFKFNVNALLRADMKSRMEFMQKGVRNGIYTPNQCCALEELPPYEGGQYHYMSKDLVRIESPAQPNA